MRGTVWPKSGVEQARGPSQQLPSSQRQQGGQPAGKQCEHWLANFTLKLAQRVEPDREWRIITSPKHSTVWDGRRLLFDFIFQAMGISPAECFELANENELDPGELLRVHLAEHWRR